MRLWIISHNYAPEPTGIPFYNTGMAEWFVRRGWEVEVLTGVPHYPWWQVPAAYAARDYRSGRGDETLNGVTVQRVRHFVPTPPPGGFARMRLDASFLAHWFHRSLYLRGRPDAIIGIAPPFLIGSLLLWLRHRLHVPVFYHVQDLQIDAAIELGQLPRILRSPLLALERWQLERVDQVSACGRGMLRRLASKGRLRRPPLHWPNWADCGAMAPCLGSDPERAALDGQVPGTVVGLYSGSLGRKQGLETLIAATRLLPAPWRTIIAGNGSERAQLTSLATGIANLSFQDLRPADRLAAFLSAADVHIITQRREAADLVLPSKLLNILAVGKPVVVTAEPGTELHEVVTAAGCGIAVRPDDPRALADALAELASDPERRRHMGEAGRRWVVAHAHIDAVLGRVEADILALIASRSAIPADR